MKKQGLMFLLVGLVVLPALILWGCGEPVRDDAYYRERALKNARQELEKYAARHQVRRRV